MNRSITCLLFLVVSLASFSQTFLIDDDWKFHRGGAQGAEDPSFNDSDWRSVDLPHDWSIEDLPGTNSPFSPDAVSQVSGGFTTGGTGWYRKSINIPAEWNGKRVTVIFDGVYMNSQCWINDTTYGFRMNGIPLKLMGGCVHHDNGPLGSRARIAARCRQCQSHEHRKLQLAKAQSLAG
ncbi:MAG TPA: hypothetical protein VK179_01055 [Bacteroidales bacterium]|nr:hypothetical protein [Bacteroidales bacterium]